MAKHTEVLARFRREVEAASHVENPNIVAATDFGQTEDCVSTRKPRAALRFSSVRPPPEGQLSSLLAPAVAPTAAAVAVVVVVAAVVLVVPVVAVVLVVDVGFDDRASRDARSPP
jgi:hypothetical protein